MKKIGNFVSTLIVIVLAGLLIAVLVSKLVYGVEMKAVLTSSMEPELPVGSLLIINPADYDEIAVGDDITFVRDENLTLVTHRVIEKDDKTQYITTQGIANNTPDKPTSYQNVVGKVIYNIPYVGYFVIWTSSLKGKIICGIIIIALVCISLLFNKSDNDEKQKQN